MSKEKQTWIGASVLAAIATAFLLAHAIPRLEDGAQSVRHAHHAMNDESVILGKTWQMVDRGDLRHGIEVYPGFYPYQVGLIRWMTLESSPRTSILATRWWSLLTMIGALLVTFFAFAAVAESPWIGALVVVAMALSPQMIEWTSRVHPDAWLLLLDHAALGCFALAVDRKSQRLLLYATILAGFSAGTKLVGCFIMVPIGVWILIERGPTWWARLRRGLLHLGVFVGVFVLTNPLLLTHGVHLLEGLWKQQRRNRRGGGGIAEWLEVILGPNALGYAGVALVLIGLGLFIRRRNVRTGAVLGFSLFYLAFILFGVRLTEARYAYPAIWPLLAVAAFQLRPVHFRRKWIPVVLGLALGGLYVGWDWPRQAEGRRDIATKYETALSAQWREVGDRLVALDAGARGPVYSSASAFVPEPLAWSVVWALDELDLGLPIGAVVLDDALRATGGPNLAALEDPTRFVATGTVGSVVIYQRR